MKRTCDIFEWVLLLNGWGWGILEMLKREWLSLLPPRKLSILLYLLKPGQ